MNKQDLEELYQEVILDHYKNPRCKGHCVSPSASVEVYNPLCGDAVTVEIKTNGSCVEEVFFTGKGCSISQASASLMAELCTGKSREQIESLHELYKSMILTEIDPEALDPLGDAAVLRGIRKFPARYRCALLAWQAMGDALEKAAGS